MCAALTTNHLVQNTLKQGPITGVNLDCRQELTTLGEPLVVVVEALQSLSAGELDADAK